MKSTATWKFPGCPEPPKWTLDWEKITHCCPWLATLRGVPQDARFHAEGDVFIHTRMVVEALVGLTEWRNLPDADRQALFAAALLHDLGKPECTRLEPDGSITSKHHGRRGEVFTRKLFWPGGDSNHETPFLIRETICALVREHGLPLWFMEKQSAARRMVATSLAARLDHLALLAEADARGRSCTDREDLVQRVELFRDYARELGCFNQPREFASPHSRFVYFHGSQANLDYQAYDNTEFEVVLMAGLPASGKDTWITQHLPGWPVVSLDEIRDELDVAPDQRQGAVVQRARERARELLRVKTPFVWNATNLTRKLRGTLINLFAAYQARVRIVYVEAPLNEIFERNRRRQRQVPERVIKDLLDKLEIPALDEAHFVEWQSLPAS